jgi:isochorismate hydrolase
MHVRLGRGIVFRGFQPPNPGNDAQGSGALKSQVTGRSAKEMMAELGPYISGHRRETHRLSRERSALLVIDMQRYFLDESSHAYLPASRGIVGNVTTIIDAFRGRSLPVIYTRHAHLDTEEPGAMDRWWKDKVMDGTEMSEIAAELKPKPGEPVLRKSRYSAFVGTALESMLRERGITGLVITGVMTHLCCETTARDAFMRDFNVFFVVDGTASETEDLHLSSLKTLTDGFAIPVTTEEVIGWLRS